MVINTPQLNGYRLSSIVRAVSSITSRSRVMATYRPSIRSLSRLKATLQKSVTSRSHITGSSVSNKEAKFSVRGDGVPLPKVSRFSVKLTTTSSKTSRSSVKPQSGTEEIGSKFCVIARTTNSKQAAFNVKSFYLHGYRLQFTNILNDHKASKFTAIGTVQKHVGSRSEVKGPRGIKSRSAIVGKQPVTSVTSQQAVKKVSTSSTTSKSFVYNPDLLTHIDGYTITFRIVVNKAIQSLQSIRKSSSASKLTLGSVRKTASSDRTSRSYIHKSIRAQFQIGEIAPQGGFRYNVYPAKYNSTARYDVRLFRIRSKFNILGTVSRLSVSRSSIKRTFASHKVYQASIRKTIQSSKQVGFWIEQTYNARTIYDRFSLFKFGLVSRWEQVQSFTFSLKPRTHAKSLGFSPDPRMKRIVRVFNFDLVARRGVKTFSFNVHPNKVYKKAKERFVPFIFDLIFRGKT